MITTTLESLLFASAKPMAVTTLKKALGVSDEVLREALDDVKARFNLEGSGIHLVEADGAVQFATNPACAAALEALTKQEASGELSRPSLETLTIIAYRGPVTKPEIEQVRGINCSLILRNLLMRGLIEEVDDAGRLQPVYTVSVKFLRHLGVHAASELPQYGELHGNERIGKMLSELGESNAEQA